MIVKGRRQLKRYQKVAQLSTDVLSRLVKAVKPGVYPIDIDNLAKQLCLKHQSQPAFINVSGEHLPYSYATCISVNDTVVHGIPSATTVFKKGDIVKLDFGLIKDRLYTDQCVTVSVGQPSDKNRQLIIAGRKAVQSAVLKAVVGNTVGDLGHAMQSVALSFGFDVLKQYTGHGIGLSLHESPIIPAHGQPHTGDSLKKGMIICVEAQLVTGSDQVFTDKKDGWSVKTKDGGQSAMFEYMVMVDYQRPVVLTPTLNWDFVV